MEKVIEVNVQSEIGKLNGVIIHTPGEEVENMTPEMPRGLYIAILSIFLSPGRSISKSKVFYQS